MDDLVTVRCVVRGRVQGVGFRAWVERRARELGVVGWTRNAPDGSVECVAASHREAIDQFIELLRKGPPLARVERVSVEPNVENSLPERFEIRY